MSAETVTLDEDALELLNVTKRPGETLSDTVRRLARRAPSPDEFAAVVPKGEAEELTQIIQENRELRLQARRRGLKLE